MLAHIDGLARLQRQGNHLAGRVARKCNVTGTLRLRHHQRHAGQQTLECSLQTHRGDRYLWIFPEQHVMREINSITSRKIDIGNRHIHTFDLTERVAELKFRHVFSAWQLRPAGLGDYVTRIYSCATCPTSSLLTVAD